MLQIPEVLFGQGVALFCDRFLNQWVKPTLGARLVRHWHGCVQCRRIYCMCRVFRVFCACVVSRVASRMSSPL